MNPKKQKTKDRRRARKLAEEAWEAFNAGNLDLAEKIIRRAVDAQQDNPVLWNDQGVILDHRQKEAEAGEAFRAAISLAPTYAEPFANLAAMRFRYGYAREALALLEQAVALAPDNAVYAERLVAYRATVVPATAHGLDVAQRVDAPAPAVVDDAWPARVAPPPVAPNGTRLRRPRW